MSITNYLWSKVLTDDRDMVRVPPPMLEVWQLILCLSSCIVCLRFAGDWRSTDRLFVPPSIFNKTLD